MALPEVLATLYPETVSKRKAPANLNPAHHALFQHEFERTIPATQLLRFTNVRASAEGLLFKGVHLLPESFAFPNELGDWKLRSILKLLGANYLFRHRRRIDNEVLWVTDYWSTGYFHWLSDALTRLYAVRDKLDQCLLLLPSSLETRDFVNPSLKAFGVNNVAFVKPNEVVECRSLLMPTHTAPPGHYRDELIRSVREILLRAFGASGNQADRIYISRRKAAKRRISNEDELAPVFERFGFQTMRAEELSFQEQIQICSRARYLVSNHGAGLTNMLFMRESGKVLELRHQSDHLRNCFFVLSSALNLHYFYQTCRQQNEEADPHTADLIVDPKALEKNLLRLVS